MIYYSGLLKIVELLSQGMAATGGITRDYGGHYQSYQYSLTEVSFI